jgi:hypothetical protein
LGVEIYQRDVRHSRCNTRHGSRAIS